MRVGLVTPNMIIKGHIRSLEYFIAYYREYNTIYFCSFITQLKWL